MRNLSVYILGITALIFAIGIGAIMLGRETTSVSAVDKSIPQGLDAIRAKGELVVATVAGPATYQRNAAGQPSGYEAGLARRLADDLGVAVRYDAKRSVRSAIEAVEKTEAHIAAAGLIKAERDETTGSYGPAYKTVRPMIACQRGDAPTSLSGLAGHEIAIVDGSPYEAALLDLATQEEAITVEARDVTSAMVLLKAVNNGRLDCAVAEDHLLAVARRRYDRLAAALPLGEEDRQLAWLVAPGSADMQPFLADWFAGLHEDGTLADLDERYFGHLEDYDRLNIETFRERIETRLPEYEANFRSAAGERNLDWTLLASQGYQESHWDEGAVSPTGVRGLMMLTRPTARELGVEDRTDPQQSIEGGAEYMARLYAQMPEDVTGYDRLWMAMAAYNVGYGHLLDARRLARRQDLDPNEWHNIDDMLPLLTKRAYFSTVPHGYARGHEPVRYVRRIREYDEVLTVSVPDPEQPPFLIDRDASAGSGLDDASSAGSGAGGDP